MKDRVEEKGCNTGKKKLQKNKPGEKQMWKAKGINLVNYQKKRENREKRGRRRERERSEREGGRERWERERGGKRKGGEGRKKRW